MPRAPPPSLIGLIPTPNGFYASGDRTYSRVLHPLPQGPPHVIDGLKPGVRFGSYLAAFSRFTSELRFRRPGDRYLEYANAEGADVPTHAPYSPPHAFALGEFIHLGQSLKRVAAVVQFYDLPDDERAWAADLNPNLNWRFGGFF